MYRHALPAGFVLKSQRKAMDDAAKANTISLEDFLEVEVSPRSRGVKRDLVSSMAHPVPVVSTKTLPF